jgi:hypothetical protein
MPELRIFSLWFAQFHMRFSVMNKLCTDYGYRFSKAQMWLLIASESLTTDCYENANSNFIIKFEYI